MAKQLLVILITMASLSVVAQSGTTSPYSFYGIGSLKFKGTVENRSMGGMSVYLDSIHVNLKNPASYAGKNLGGQFFNNESRPVKFTVAGTHTDAKFEGNNSNGEASSSAFDYIALSFPVGKLGVGFGILPFTSVGYKLEDINDTGDLQNRFRGEGGLNRVFAGLGYSITDKLSIGADFNYNFGNIENTAISFAYTPTGDIVQYQTRQNTRSDLSGLTVNLGLAYKTMITDKLELSATATYSPESKLSSNNQRTLSTIAYDSTNDIELDLNSQEVDLGANENTKLTLPSSMSFGAGIGQPKSWFVGAEYTLQNTSSFSNPIYSNAVTNFENASEISLGGFYIPDYDAFSGYFKRIVYRAGFRFANSGLVVKDESINEFGISFGLGLPVGNPGLFSNANIGVEFGQRGTTNQNLIQENFVNLNISLSLNSRWFQKRKYN